MERLGFCPNCFLQYQLWPLQELQQEPPRGSLGLSDPVELNPDGANIYYASHIRLDRGNEKLETILKPFVLKLKAKRNQMPLTLVYGNLETIADCFPYFSNNMHG